MRLTTRIAVGAGSLVVLLLAVLVYDLAQMRRLASMHRSLSETDLRATALSLEQTRLLNRLDEFARKLVVTRDQAYAGALVELRQGFAARLDEIESLALSQAVREETAELRALWAEFPFAGLERHVLAAERDAQGETLLLDALADYSRRLRLQSEEVTAATQAAVAAEAARSAAASRRAGTVSLAVVAAALTLSLPLLWWTVNSIRQALTRLTEGTRSVAGGSFSTLVETAGSDEFSGLASSFNEMVRRLGELDRMKHDFLSHVSHELKTPLVAMEETNRLLLDEMPGKLNAKQRRLLELNLEGSRRLGAMISRLLDLARLEEGAVAYDFAEHDLAALAREVRESFLARAGELRIALELEAPDEPVTVRCDRDRVYQVIVNLLDNALKFSPRDGAVRLRVAAISGLADSSGAAGGGGLLEVIDSGPGVGAADKERIFEKFHQADISTAGVGLGLAICRQIAEAHSGTVRVADNPGGGSVFSLTLPPPAPAALRSVGA